MLIGRAFGRLVAGGHFTSWETETQGQLVTDLGTMSILLGDIERARASHDAQRHLDEDALLADPCG